MPPRSDLATDTVTPTSTAWTSALVASSENTLPAVGIGLYNLALVEEMRGYLARAAHLLGATQMCQDSLKLNYHVERRDETEVAAKLRATIGESEFAAEFERGFSLNLEQAVALATQNTEG